MIALGLRQERAWKSSVNGRGPWSNAGSLHRLHALNNACFEARGLISIRRTGGAFSVFTGPPYVELHVRWCARAEGVTSHPTQLGNALFSPVLIIFHSFPLPLP